LTRRQEQLLGPSGLITKDLDNILAKLPPDYTDQVIYGLLLQLPQGSRATFDRRSHRRVVQRTNRLTYVYYAARSLEDRKPEEVADQVLEHLEHAQELICSAWAEAEFDRLANASLSDIQETTRRGLLRALELSEDTPVLNLTLNSLDAEQRAIVTGELGRRVLSNVYRQLLLGVITELWVDYLTQMESLRVSIGLEAYAQRDPLVQYKSRASELFQTLQSNIRLGVITRIFTYRPRDLSRIQTGSSVEATLVDEDEFSEAEPPEESVPQLESQKTNGSPVNQSKPESGGKKRHRRRR
jgi:preprotein translocase subunit SecA